MRAVCGALYHKRMDYICTHCGARREINGAPPRCECGGLWKLATPALAFSSALCDDAAQGVFRYRAFMPLSGEGWRRVTMGEGNTPLVRLDDDVTLKFDALMPTLSYKDRGAAVLAAHMSDMGVTRAVQDSSGNAGNSVAAYCARAGIECEIYVPEGASPGKIAMIRAHGARCVVVDGTRDHCAQVCRERVHEGGAYYASHVYDPFFYEGTKTYIYEVYERMGRIPENVFLPLGNGTLFIGVMQGLIHLLDSGCIRKMPRVFAVQSERCAPILEAVRRGMSRPAEITPQATLAEGIAIGRPMRGEEILSLIARYDVCVVGAPEEGIIPARERLLRRGISSEHTSAAIYAAYTALVEGGARLADTLIPITGAGLKSEH